MKWDGARTASERLEVLEHMNLPLRDEHATRDYVWALVDVVQTLEREHAATLRRVAALEAALINWARGGTK